jgi:hypothetical protein
VFFSAGGPRARLPRAGKTASATDHFGDQNVRSTFAGFSLCGEAPSAGERGGPLRGGLPDVTQHQKQKSNEDYDIQR